MQREKLKKKEMKELIIEEINQRVQQNILLHYFSSI